MHLRLVWDEEEEDHVTTSSYVHVRQGGAVWNILDHHQIAWPWERRCKARRNTKVNMLQSRVVICSQCALMKRNNWVKKARSTKTTTRTEGEEKRGEKKEKQLNERQKSQKARFFVHVA